jgi:uncharacterized membrane protein
MTDMPQRTLYHRSLGWHAPEMRRAVVVMALGVLAAGALLPGGNPEVAAVGGWDVAALAFLVAVWRIVLGADGEHTRHLARREDETRTSARALLVAASLASLVGVGAALSLAGDRTGPRQVALIAFAVLTVVVSWTVVNTLYTLRYADLHFSSPTGIDFGDPADDAGAAAPCYRDFAYLAFTIGMTYQVSDTALRDTRIRRSVLAHALLSYLFGVVIVSGTVSLIAGLVR